MRCIEKDRFARKMVALSDCRGDTVREVEGESDEIGGDDDRAATLGVFQRERLGIEIVDGSFRWFKCKNLLFGCADGSRLLVTICPSGHPQSA
jgi:hypothetical protein